MEAGDPHRSVACAREIGVQTAQTPTEVQVRRNRYCVPVILVENCFRLAFTTKFCAALRDELINLDKNGAGGDGDDGGEKPPPPPG